MPAHAAMPTVGEIERRTGYPLHRIEYIIRARGIQPAGRAGNVRVFAEDDVELIAEELRKIDAERDAAGMATCG